MFKIFTQLLNLIYKKRCYFCGSTKENILMCSKCFEKQTLLPTKIITHKEGIPFYSATIYQNNMQKLIRGLKYHNKKELAFYQAKIMYNYWSKLTKSDEKFVVIPVPLFSKRERKRKYNHMTLVAQEFAKLSGYKVNLELIKRVKDTKPQYKLSKKEREENLKNAFECNLISYEGEKLLLIDDILTTGSTMTEMIKTFQNKNINDLTVFVTSCTEYHLH